jgi:hypothetical protein
MKQDHYPKRQIYVLMSGTISHIFDICYLYIYGIILNPGLLRKEPTPCNIWLHQSQVHLNPNSKSVFETNEELSAHG